MEQKCKFCNKRVEEHLELEPDELQQPDVYSPVCASCLERRLHKILEELGNPIILDEETNEINMPKGIQN